MIKKFNMGQGAGAGLHGTNAKRVYSWLWHSWVEAQREVPHLRWASVAAVLCALGAFALAIAEGKTWLELGIYSMTAFLFVMAIPAIDYLLFEIYRRHRSDAIFDSKRLAEHIRAIAKEEVEANEESKMALENRLLVMKTDKAFKK